MSYDASAIEVLEGLDPVRKRPAMYIGTTGPEGLHHLVYEVVDNSVDEARRRLLQADRRRSCTRTAASPSIDDGRGIPVDEHPTEKRPAAEVVMTTLHAGGKFNDKHLQGLGRPARRRRLGGERALRVARARDPARRQGLAPDATGAASPTSALEEIGTTDKTGTRVTFLPDPQIFASIEFEFDVLSQRLRELSFLNAGLRINISDERSGKKPRLLLRGRHRLVRRAPEPQPRAAAPAADPRLGRAQMHAGRHGGAGRDRDRDPVQRDATTRSSTRSRTTSTRSRAAAT